MQDLIVVGGVAVFIVVTAWFCIFSEFPSSGPKVVMQAPTPPPPAPKEMTVKDIAHATGENDGPIYLAIDGIVFDVTEGREFYGPGKGYNVFAGRDATIGLGMMQTDPSQWKKNSVEDLTLQEMESMSGWRTRFLRKYPVIGALTDGSNPSTLTSLRERGICK